MKRAELHYKCWFEYQCEESVMTTTEEPLKLISNFNYSSFASLDTETKLSIVLHNCPVN